MIYITHIRMSSGATTHERITDVKWFEPSTNNTGSFTVAAAVDWIDVKKGDARVKDGRDEVNVGVVRPTSGSPYLRTHADGKWTDNLLALPKF